jgi:hypothetical protein
MTLLEAIARMEGFYEEGSRPNRNNNPGDLAYGSEALRFGASGSDGRYAVFPNADIGWTALRRWLSVPAEFENGQLVAGYLGATIEQALNRFAPPSENNTNAYVVNVCSWTGLMPDTRLTVGLLVPHGL